MNRFYSRTALVGIALLLVQTSFECKGHQGFWWSSAAMTFGALGFLTLLAATLVLIEDQTARICGGRL